MIRDFSSDQARTAFKLLWLLMGLILLTLLAYLFVSEYYWEQIRVFQVSQDRLVWIRTILYILAIIAFPITNLMRFIMVRLNQTMPGEATAKQRYFVTVLVSMISAGTIGMLGFIMFVLGDDYNTLYIFCVLSALAVFLYRPKIEEYLSIVEALQAQQEEVSD